MALEFRWLKLKETFDILLDEYSINNLSNNSIETTNFEEKNHSLKILILIILM